MNASTIARLFFIPLTTLFVSMALGAFADDENVDKSDVSIGYIYGVIVTIITAVVTGLQGGGW